ncbi:MAG: glycosyl transferase family 2, partial [Cyanobacteria bacterium P01_C01_bin.73]
HFLSAKLFCLNSYRFSDRPDLEQSRLAKANGLRQVLALRLIEKGESKKGRQLIQELQQAGALSSRAKVGLALSYLPVALRQLVFQGFRNARPKDYSERVRDTAG